MFNQTFRNLGRMREILAVLVKYGFEDIVTNSTLRNFVSEGRRLSWIRQEKPVFEYTRWERIRMVAEELGPTFIKLAQVLSIRPDMMPEPLIKEFEKLQDRVPPFPFAQAKIIIEREIGCTISEVFSEFDERPLASASIGQVHKARLRTGQDVVVKVQRPGVGEIIERDLAIIKDVVNRADRYLKKQGVLNAADVVHAFERSITKEIDYNNEARNIERFRNFYKSYKNFYIPRAYREFSTDKILIIEYADGCKINDMVQIRAWGLDPRKVAENGMDIYLTQIFEFGLFHADPHPGNVMVRRDGVICLIDFGMTGQLMPKDKQNFAGIFVSMSQQDAKRMANALRKLSISDNIEDTRQFQYDLNEIIEDFIGLNVSESSIADMVTRLQKVMFDYKIVVPASVFLIFRAFAILEGIGKQIHPHFNTYEFIRPYGKKIIEEQFSPKNLLNEALYRTEQMTDFASGLPRDLKELLAKLKKGKIHFEVEHQGYGYLLKKWDSLTNRIVMAMLMVSFIIGSAISMTANWGPDMPRQYGIPEISLYGLLCAAVLGVMLFYSVLRRRTYK